MERSAFRAVSLPWLMKEIRAARPRDAKAALAPAETRAATPLWTVPRQPSDFGRRRVSGAETWNSTRLRYRTRPMFRSDLEHSLYSRMWIWRGSDASASAVLGRPEFEEGKGRSGLLCQVLYSRTLDLERVRRLVRRGRLAVVRPEFEEGKGRSGLLVSSAGAVAAGNWIPMLKGGL